MKLIALCTIYADGGRVRPGKPFEVASEEEGGSLIKREFAREPTEDELAMHWPDGAAADAKAAAEAKAKAEAEAAAKAEAEAQAKAAADAKAAAPKPTAKK